MYPVVVGTNPERSPWLDDCLNSIYATSSTNRTVYVHTEGGYEPAAIRSGCARFTRFLFIHDSVTILDPEFWAIIDASEPAWLGGAPHMLIGIYDAETVLPHLPTHEVTKRETVELEGTLPTHINMGTIWPDIVDGNRLRWEHRHGRDNLVLGNHLWEKHKGHWGQGPL